MSLSSKTVIQGDSLDVGFKFDDSRDLTDFTCQLQVRDSGDAITGIDRAIATMNADSTTFIARITPAETGALAVGTYTLSGQLLNVTTSESLELPATLIIAKQYNY